MYIIYNLYMSIYISFMTRPSYFGPKPKIKKKAQNSLFWAFQNPYFGLFWAFFLKNFKIRIKLILLCITTLILLTYNVRRTLISIIMYDSYYIFNNYHIIYHI